MSDKNQTENTVDLPNKNADENPESSNTDTPMTDNKSTTTGKSDPIQQELEQLRQELEQARKEARDNLDGWQRARAEFTNYKKRMEKQLSESGDRIASDTLSKVLPIIDDFERALANIPEYLAENPWVSGTSLIMRKFDKLLEEHSVEIIDPVGEEFDPRIHEAIGMDDSDEVESGHVTVTLQKGYKSGERVLRPALVRVAN